VRNVFLKRKPVLATTDQVQLLKTGLKQFGSIFPVHRDHIVAQGEVNLHNIRQFSCSSLGRDRSKLLLQVVNCGFWNSKSLTGFKKPFWWPFCLFTGHNLSQSVKKRIFHTISVSDNILT